jgi:DNA mismatch repair protein MutL
LTLIRRLPHEVADAIAAGEVIERPASVVKELVENALDAGARRVAVEVRGAGRTLIRVADDGAGIPAGELALAFTRHATSKVRTVEDLDGVSTLGFRGEALASIAAVSEVECRSSGEMVRIRAGEVVEEGPAGTAPGAVLEVRDLFASTPARLKFLKSDATESAAVLRAVSAYALLYPEVRFHLRLEERTALSTAGDGDLRRAMISVHGGAVGPELLEVAAEGVRGMVSQPRLSRGSRDGILLAVNRRPIASRALAFALEECYLGSLERGRYPIAVLDVAAQPGTVDVNVHPAKREVRFRDERAVFGLVQRAVRAALSGSQPYRIPSPRTAEMRPAHAGPPAAGHVLRDARPAAAPLAPAMEPAQAGPAGVLRPVGQVLDGYLVAEGGDGLVLVDQHAAHERVLYNRFLARLRSGGGASQPLLLPETIELDPLQVAAAADHRERLVALGFELEDFGPRTLRLLAAPAETPPGRALAALTEMLGALAESRRGEGLERAAASLACHSAVRFGDPLEPAEQRRLLEELEAAEDAVTCPHGRPTRLLLGWPDLKRHFRRNY